MGWHQDHGFALQAKSHGKNAYGQESPRWISLFKLAFFLNTQKHNFFGKIGWSMNSERRWAGGS